jgi:hypothetical protein
VLAFLAGARLIAPAETVKRGAIVLWNVGSLERLLATLTAHGLRAAPVASLSTTELGSGHPDPQLTTRESRRPQLQPGVGEAGAR